MGIGRKDDTMIDGTPIGRTMQELSERTREAEKRDMLGFEWHEYTRAMDYQTCRSWLKEGYKEEDYKKDGPITIEKLDAEAKEYMAFWLEKIQGERGISVYRATSHFIAWKWMLKHPDADTFPGSIRGDDGGYYQRTAYEYIKNQIDSGEWDRLTRENNQEPCEETEDGAGVEAD